MQIPQDTEHSAQQTPHPVSPEAIDQFIDRWSNAGGTERANYQLFLTGLCELLGLPHPDPATDDNADNAYVFERRVTIRHPDGSSNRGYIDLYRRGSFVLEAKQTGKSLDTHGWDKAMLAAQNQADQYVRALPGKEGRPPFIIVTDVGRSLELYAEFTRSGGTYVPYPDPSRHRIRLEDLRDPAIQQRLRLLWLDPDQLDTSKQAARVTQQVSEQLAELARSLEQEGYAVERVAHFLKRCLFTMFSEDVELLPKESFTRLLERLQETPEHFPDAVRSLWETMNTGGYEGHLMQKIQCFNGGLFKGIDPIPLNADQIGLLIKAARADWRYVEPAIFGTLLERALDPRERHKLGAHYTPRAYVERLVMPTIIEPLRAEWRMVLVAVEAWLQQGKEKKALEEIQQFHHHLCQVRVLDPACGSANFLYVALEHFKRLEGEVQNVLGALSSGQFSMEAAGLTVDPHQFLGMELNPRAAAIAEMVLWIGYLQWHHKINGKLDLPEPILRNFNNIQNRDALIEYDSREAMLDEQGNEVTIWDGISYKTSPVTGELVPDETQRITVYKYINPRKASWPEADYIVGNPPFIGDKAMRRALGGGYVEALRETWSVIPESTDFVMYWWHISAEKVRKGEAKRFGFITTNSVRQTFNRRVLQPHLDNDKNPLSLAFAIPDHPWVDSNNGASVRIAMTVGIAGDQPGVLHTIVNERKNGDEGRAVTLGSRAGKIFSDLTIGANVAGARKLKANSGISSNGVMLAGSGFIVTREEAKSLGYPDHPGIKNVIREYRNGRDMTQTPRDVMVIDLFEKTAEDVRDHFPAVYQRVCERVKPERDNNRRKKLRETWWQFGEPRVNWRSASSGLKRFISTVETTKHRFFVFMDAEILPDHKLINIALDDAYSLGVLSSRLHCVWSIATGSTLEDRPVYPKTQCFETFPFPELSEGAAKQIGDLAEKLDAHRKRQQDLHSGLTLTGMYNVLEKVRKGVTLTPQDQEIHQQGLISILKELHDDIDLAVLSAYGWDDLADALVGRPGATTPMADKPEDLVKAEEELLSRLVALNTERAAQEAQGRVHWVRPDYQAPEASQATVELAQESVAAAAPEPEKPLPWPKSMPEQVRAVCGVLEQGPQAEPIIVARFKRKPAKAVAQVLAALNVMGQAQLDGELWKRV
jgi:hypothetical protein